MPSDAPVRAVVVSGVAGTGKTTVGRATAEALGWEFVDGDTLHPAANVAKMRAGTPLEDADRAPWLTALRALLDRCLADQPDREAAGGAGPLVLATSALKRRYRERLGIPRPRLCWVHLTAPRSVLEARVARRPDHFMPAALLESQLDDLEPPEPHEGALFLDTARPLHELIPAIVRVLRGEPAPAQFDTSYRRRNKST